MHNRLRYFSFILLVAFFISVFSAACLAPRTARTTIFNGVVKKTVMGDIACYVDVVNEYGTAETLKADFSVCEKKLAGKKVRYHMGWAKFASPKCEGDPECKKTVREWAIKSVELR